MFILRKNYDKLRDDLAHAKAREAAVEAENRLLKDQLIRAQGQADLALDDLRRVFGVKPRVIVEKAPTTDEGARNAGMKNEEMQVARMPRHLMAEMQRKRDKAEQDEQLQRVNAAIAEAMTELKLKGEI